MLSLTNAAAVASSSNGYARRSPAPATTPKPITAVRAGTRGTIPSTSARPVMVPYAQGLERSTDVRFNVRFRVSGCPGRRRR